MGCDFSEAGALDGMPVRAGEVAMTLWVRALSEEEAHRLARMTRSQKLGAGLVRRAQIIQHAVDGLSAPEIAARMGLCGATVRFWLKRFKERGRVIAAALSRPAELGLPFASWTLDRLVAYLGEKGIGMKRSRVSEVLLAEGLKWRQEETWFGARVDPQFARKRSHGRRTAGLVKSGGPHLLPTRETAHARLRRSYPEADQRRHDLPRL